MSAWFYNTLAEGSKIQVVKARKDRAEAERERDWRRCQYLESVEKAFYNQYLIALAKAREAYRKEIA